MAFSRLLLLPLLLGLINSAAASTFPAAPPPPGCDLSTLAPKLARHCQSDPDVPTTQCCEALLTSVPGQEDTALPCLCRAAAESPLVTANLDVARLFALYRGCSNGSFGRDPGFANWYCEVDRAMDTATAVCTAETLATKVSQFCVTEERFPECCMAVVNTVVLIGRPPCLCRVAAEPQLAAAGLNATGILELYSACGGRSPVGPHLVDACNGWYLRAPALPNQGATTAAILTPPMAASSSCAPKTLAFLMVYYVYKDPTALTCRDLVDSVDLGGGVPCLCRAAAESYAIRAQLKATDFLAIYNACGGLRLGGADHKAAAASCEGYGLSLPLPPSDKPPTTPPQEHDAGAIHAGPDTLPETATA